MPSLRLSAWLPASPAFQAKAEQFAAEFTAALDALLANPRRDLPGFKAQPVSCASLCHVRCGLGVGCQALLFLKRYAAAAWHDCSSVCPEQQVP
jgi:hypothetical protein